MIKKTFEELKEIDELYGKLLGNEGFANTKLGYAFKRFSDKNLKEIFQDFNDTLQDIRISNALTDKTTGAILYTSDQKNYQYTPEGLKTTLKLIKEKNKEYSDKEFEVKPFIYTDLGTIELLDEEKELIKGVIIE